MEGENFHSTVASATVAATPSLWGGVAMVRLADRGHRTAVFAIVPKLLTRRKTNLTILYVVLPGYM
jgi:hypothetical protein